MKTALAITIMVGAIFALHDTPTFMSATTWIIIALMGLIPIIVTSIDALTLPPCRLTNAFTSISAFCLFYGGMMALITGFIDNSTFVGYIAAFSVIIFACMARSLYTHSNRFDLEEEMQTEFVGEHVLPPPYDYDDLYAGEHPATDDDVIGS